MSTAALRGILIVIALLIGFLVVAKAFPESAALTTPKPAQPSPATQPAAAPQSAVSTSPATAAAGTASPGTAAKATRVKGIVIQVLNGTNSTGLAADTANELEKHGYKIKTVGNAAKTYQVTTLFYRQDSQQHATLLMQDFFPNARLAPVNNNLEQDVQVTVVVGEDARS